MPARIIRIVLIVLAICTIAVSVLALVKVAPTFLAVLLGTITAILALCNDYLIDKR